MALKGDLQNVQLADLFQTLSMNSQEGVLRLRENEKEYRLYFHPRGITLLNPSVSGRRRLGQMLLESDLISPADLEQALAIQSQTGRFLGEIFVQRDLVTQEQLDSILARQIEEEIYSLFSLTRARFEFREGPPLGESAPVDTFFNVESIVLEAARRMDEWELINKVIDDLEAIYVPHEDHEQAPPEKPELWDVFALLDGTRSIYGVSDCLLASTFETAKSIVQLIEGGFIRPANPTELVRAAQTSVKEGRAAKAQSILNQAANQIDDSSSGLLPVVARLLRQVGDDRRSAFVELEISRLLTHQGDYSAAREKLEGALKLAPNEADILMAMAEACRMEGDPDAEIEHLQPLITQLTGQMRFVESLVSLDRLQELDPDNPLLAQHYLSASKGCRRPEKGVGFLENVLAQAGSGADPAALENVYKQILELDPTRGDIGRLLRRLQARQRRSRQTKVGVAFTLILLISGGGFFGVRSIKRRQALDEISPIEEQLQLGNLDDANALFHSIVTRIDRKLVSHELGNLELAIEQQLGAREKETQNRELSTVLNGLAEVQALVEDERFVDALAAFLENVEGVNVKKFESQLTLKLQTMLTIIRDRRDALNTAANRFTIPDLRATSQESLASLRDEFSPIFSSERYSEYSRLAFFAERAAEELPIGVELTSEISRVANHIVKLFEPAKNSLQEVESRLVELNSLDDMDEDYQLARDAESRAELELARDLYRSLLEKYGEGGLTGHFRSKLQRVVAAIADSKVIETKVSQGDFKAAHFASLDTIQKFPDFNLERRIRVPVEVRTFPTNARISVKPGDVKGSILLLPAEGEVEVTIRAEGFEEEKLTISPTKTSSIEIDLVRRSMLKMNLGSPLESAPAVHGTQVFMGGRDGVLRGIDIVRGEVDRRFETEALSGIVGSPVIEDGRVFIAADSRVLAFDEHTFKLLWEINFDRPLEYGIVSRENVLVAIEHGSSDDTLHVIRPDNGTIIWSKSPGGVVSGLPSVVNSFVVVGLKSGHFVGLQLDDRLSWANRLASGFVGSTVDGGDSSVILACDDGSLIKVLVEQRKSSVLATAKLEETVIVEPVVVGKYVYATTGRTLTALSYETLEEQWILRSDRPFSSPPGFLDERVYIGSEDGKLLAYDIATQELIFRSPMGARVVAQPVATSSGLLIMTMRGDLFLIRR